MSWRTVIVSQQAKLDYKMGYMVVRGEETRRVLIDEIAILLLENPAVALTGCLIEKLVEKKVRVIFCDSTRSPTAELTPYRGSHDSSAKLRAQAVWDAETKAAVWREIVAEKIRQQYVFLLSLKKTEEAALLDTYRRQVEPGDATNREGHAAKVYFNALFGKSFTRGALDPRNAALNYGYSLILSAVNREVAVNGYLTQFGIFHDNMFNPFNLSCDLMEPFRVLVDRMVYTMPLPSFETADKHALWKLLEQPVAIDGCRQLTANAIKIYVRSVFDAINDRDPAKLLFFEIIEDG